MTASQVHERLLDRNFTLLCDTMRRVRDSAESIRIGNEHIRRSMEAVRQSRRRLEGGIPEPSLADSPPSRRDFHVVCLSGSAGAIEAYSEILRHLPPDTGMAFIIVAHLSAEQIEVLPSLLAPATTMPVREVTQGMALAPNQIVVMPSGMEMVLGDQDCLILNAELERRAWPAAIGRFLRSMADALGNRAIAVILSGMGHDGMSDLKAIKQAGGVTLAQAAAAFGEMPQSAVDTGHVDFVLTAGEIADRLTGIARTAVV
jgi:two-component system CheB/CheR fusion protein